MIVEARKLDSASHPLPVFLPISALLVRQTGNLVKFLGFTYHMNAIFCIWDPKKFVWKTECCEIVWIIMNNSVFKMRFLAPRKHTILPIQIYFNGQRISFLLILRSKWNSYTDRTKNMYSSCERKSACTAVTYCEGLTWKWKRDTKLMVV